MHFGVLGGLQVQDAGGEQIAVGGPLPRTLLAALLVAEGRPVPADTLLELLWDGRPPPSATGTLHSTVSRLRRVLGPDGGRLLRLEPAGYRLVVPPEQYDVHQFEQAAEEGRRLLDGGRPAEAADVLRRGERLWRGPALAEFTDRDFARACALRLTERRLTALEDRLEAELRTGRSEAVLGELHSLVDEHPLRERLSAQLALALYRSGRQAEALAVLAATRRLLRDELGLDLSAPLRALEQAVLQQDGALLDLPRDAAAPDPGSERREEPPLVGRDREFAALREVVDQVSAGRTRFALVVGEPGIGKTRLLEEVAAHAGRTGARTVWGRCSEAELAPAYGPWIEALRALVTDAGDVPAELGTLLQPDGTGSSEATQDRRFRLFEAVLAVLTRMAVSRPLVLLLEDVHWADPASAELLQHLAVRLHDLPVAVVASLRDLDLGRDDAVSAAVATISRRSATRRLHLSGLPGSATAALVRGAVEADVSDDVAAALHRRAEGNPFCIAELSRLLSAEQLAGDPGAVDRAEVPAGVRDVVRRRLSTLPEQTRRVLEVAAVAGRQCDLTVLVAASGLSADACIDALEPALVSHVVVPVQETPGRHRFAHALLREAALAEVSSLHSARVHARVAEALSRTAGDEEAEIIAQHLWAAAAIVGPEPAAEALERAAGVALRRTAYEAADELLERALQLRRQAGRSREADERELRTTFRLVSLRRARQGYSRAVATLPLERAEELARRCGRDDLYMGLLQARWGALGTAGHVEEALRVAEQMLALGRSSDDPVVALLGRAAWGVQCWHLGRLPEAVASLDGMQAALSALDTEDVDRLAALDGIVLFSAFSLHVRELAGLGSATADLEQLRRSWSDPYDVLVVCNFAGLTAVCCGDALRARHWGQLALALDTDRGFTFFGAACEMYLGWARAVLEDPVEGLAVFERGFDRYELTGARTGLGLFVGLRVDALLRAGRAPEDAAEVLLRGAAEVARTGELFALPYLDLARARLAAAVGEPGAAVTGHLAAAADKGGRFGMPPIADLVRRTATELGVPAPASLGAGGRPGGVEQQERGTAVQEEVL